MQAFVEGPDSPGLRILLVGSGASRGALQPAWRALMLQHPDRFLLGSGTYSTRYWYQVRTTVANYRRWLREFPDDVAERIAYRNGLELFGLPDTQVDRQEERARATAAE